MTAQKFVDLHLEKGRHSRDIGYHYDMHPSSQVTMVLFQALILKCVVAGDDKIHHFSQASNFYLEIAESLNKDLPSTIFSFLPNIQHQFNLNEYDVDPRPESDIQIICHCLNLTQPIASIDAFLNTLRSTALPKAQCINLINTHIVSRIQTPNFYLINAFVNLVAD